MERYILYMAVLQPLLHCRPFEAKIQIVAPIYWTTTYYSIFWNFGGCFCQRFGFTRSKVKEDMKDTFRGLVCSINVFLIKGLLINPFAVRCMQPTGWSGPRWTATGLPPWTVIGENQLRGTRNTGETETKNKKNWQTPIGSSQRRWLKDGQK